MTDFDDHGRFKPGNTVSKLGGRPIGARSKLTTAFLDDLKEVWSTHGKAALLRCAVEEPAQFVRVVAGLMPKDINLDVSIDAADFADKFRAALEALHDGEMPELPRKPMRLLNGRR